MFTILRRSAVYNNHGGTIVPWKMWPTVEFVYADSNFTKTIPIAIQLGTTGNINETECRAEEAH